MSKRTIVILTLAKVAAAVSLAVWCALQLRRLDAYMGIRPPTWTRLPGAICAIAGVALVLICGAILSTRGILTPGDPLFPKEFVAFGPFRYVRNPMSLGLVVLMVGLGLYERSPSILLLSPLLFLLLHLLVIFFEEPGLELRFGDSYRAYKCSVNRWLPGFRSFVSAKLGNNLERPEHGR